MKQSLQFRADGTFTIVQFTDVHWHDGKHSELEADKANERTRALMVQVLEAEKPDLVVFTGDVISAGHCRDPFQSFRDAVSTVEQSGIPWAVCFGNHDTEALITRRQLMEVVKGHKHAIAEAGPDGVSGCGNYVLPVADADGRTAAALYVLDSGNVSELSHVKGYDWIRRDQIDWYMRESRRSPPITEARRCRRLRSSTFLCRNTRRYGKAGAAAAANGRKYAALRSIPVFSRRWSKWATSWVRSSATIILTITRGRCTASGCATAGRRDITRMGGKGFSAVPERLRCGPESDASKHGAA
ncbi:metallophosphoesterase [Gordoniibacillus kamchatkensis]|uniref:metallophosphoesterase n=1 Tax=Gordoniibacillus kamchatkensis TaxID=1590651 RepID=UPI000AE04000